MKIPIQPYEPTTPKEFVDFYRKTVNSKFQESARRRLDQYEEWEYDKEEKQ